MCWWLAVSCESFGSGVDWYGSGGYGVEKGAGVVGSVNNRKVLVHNVQADKLETISGSSSCDGGGQGDGWGCWSILNDDGLKDASRG
jgi:hypothetical protein